eukprot:CAMPEP_0174879814 /NCGR_PEP_ID=MMETSP1114-20130205/83451_1 /TAXON_ID=312471 /ORGANISM="Neobodo designis, Strain CCAP 1951/1" /LENGTH=324 /DNA_ID=CAMNT_0016115209 /DNA_START=74 /DNA_END=1048 /DNA_ORIENTATION=+
MLQNHPTLSSPMNIPAVLAVAQKGHGATMVLQRLVGCYWGSQDTKIPMCVQLRRGPKQPPRIRTIPIDAAGNRAAANATGTAWQPIDVDRRENQFGDAVAAFVDTVVQGRPFVVDTLVQLEIQDPHAPHLDVYDVPGQRCLDADTDGAIRTAVGNLIARIKGFTRFLLVRSATADPANSSVVGFMREQGVFDSKVVGVLTRVDLCIPFSAAAVDGDDTDDAENPVVKVVQAVAEADVPTWVVTASPVGKKTVDTQLAADTSIGDGSGLVKGDLTLAAAAANEASTLHRLKENARRTGHTGHFEMLSDKWGVDRLRAHVRDVLRE